MPIDYNKYPPNWKTEIAPAVMKRAGGQCEFCGLENGAIVKSFKINMVDESGRKKQKTFWFESESDFRRASACASGAVKDVKVVLTVAHLDHDEGNENVRMDRLAALCQYCHLNYDAREKAQRRAQKRGDSRSGEKDIRRRESVEKRQH